MRIEHVENAPLGYACVGRPDHVQHLHWRQGPGVRIAKIGFHVQSGVQAYLSAKRRSRQCRFRVA